MRIRPLLESERNYKNESQLENSAEPIVESIFETLKIENEFTVKAYAPPVYLYGDKLYLCIMKILITRNQKLQL